MTIYFVAVLLIALWAALLKNSNYSYKRKKRFMVLAFGLLILIAVLRSPSVGRDLAGHYAQNYQNIASLSWNQLSDFSTLSGYEIGYVVLCKTLSLISNNVQWFITVVSIFVYYVTARFILKNSEDVVLSTFIEIFSCSYYMYLNILRQSLAVSIVLLGYEFLKNKEIKRFKRYLIFALFVVVATTFHQSAIISLVFILFDTLRFERRHIILASVVVMGFYFLYDKLYAFTLMVVGNSDRYATYLSTAEGVGSIDWISMINIALTFGAFVLGYITLVWNKKRNLNITDKNNKEFVIEHENSVLMYACLMAGTFRLLTSQMNILNRATYYFLPFIFILYPTAVNSSGRYRKLVKCCLYIAYFAYFCIITTKVAGEYYGTVPYKFFWQ